MTSPRDTLVAMESLEPRRPPGQEELPYDDGEPMETERHLKQMVLLIETLQTAWRGRRAFYVGGNMFLYYSELQSRRNDFRGPDVFVVLDTDPEERERWKERKSWVVWEEGGRLPNVIVELVSQSTEQVDRVEKMKLYAAVLRVPEYFIYDPLTHRFDGYRLESGQSKYVPIAPDARGDLPSMQLGLALGPRDLPYSNLDGPLLRWIDEQGAPLPTEEELATRAEQRAAAAEQEAAEAKRELAEARRRLAEMAARHGDAQNEGPKG